MAITLGNSVVFGSSSGSGGTSSAISVTAGQLIVVHIITGSTLSSTPTVSSSQSDSFTAIGTHTLNNGTASGGNPFQSLTYYCSSAVGGSTTFTVSDSGGGFPTIIVQCYNNAAYDSIASAYAVQNGTSPFASADITTNANNGWLVGCCGTAQAGTTITFSGSNSTTVDVQESNNSFWTGAIGHKAYSGATTDHCAFTNSATPSATDATTITFAIRDTGGGGVSVTLTGQSTTASRGTLVPEVDVAPSGQAVTASRGTPTAQVAYTLAGQAATGAQGTVTAQVTVTLNGLAATATQGTVTTTGGNVFATLTGLSATASRGTLTPEVDVVPNGQVATTARGTLTPQVTVLASGIVVTAAQGTVTVASGPNVSIAGQQVTAVQGTPTASVSITLTGLSVGMFGGSVSVSGSASPGTIWPSNVQTRYTDQRRLVAAIDPNWNEPITTYEFGGPRRFTERQDAPYD